MKPLSDKWIKTYKEMTKKEFDARLPYKKNWLGAWRLMRDFQNTDTVKK